MTPDFPAMIVRMRTTGGATAGDPVTGYAVSCDPGCEWVIPAPLTDAEALQAHWNRWAPQHAGPQRRLGVWTDDGFAYIDIATIIENLDEAMALGRLHGQIAIYDIAAGREIRL